MSSADELTNLGTKSGDSAGVGHLSVALIGPDEKARRALADAIAETSVTNLREFDSYPPQLDDLQKLLDTFDVIFVDLDSDHDIALQLVERASASESAAIMVYSKRADTKQAVRVMRAGAREYILLPLEQGVVSEVLAKVESDLHEKVQPEQKSLGKLLVFAGSKGGSGVTTVACNIAIAVAQNTEENTLLIDLALPIGDAALCLGIAAEYSTEDALRNIDRLDTSFLQEVVVKHRSGISVLAAPTQVSELEVSKESIAKLIAVARRGFDQVVVDMGSRTDAVAKALFKEASTIYLITQTGISDLRNSNRFVTQFFPEGGPKLEVVINRFESRVMDAVNEDVIAKALGRPVRWKIPNDWEAARELQYGETGITETGISRACLEMASSITGRPIPQEKKKGFALRGFGKSAAKMTPDNDGPASMMPVAQATARTAPTIEWPTPEPISYGDALTAEQLNATASLPGTYVYTPGPGYVLRAGTHTLWVAFTPADSDGEAPLRAAVSIVVDKAMPSLSWPTPAGISYGTALDDSQLNAASSVPGTFDYSPARGELLATGTHMLEVTFTPADSTNFAPVQASVLLTVSQAATDVIWPVLHPITYGTLLSKAQLCATTWAPGTFEYDPGLQSLLAVGEHHLSVVFTPADTSEYSASRTGATLTVAKATPQIIWQAPDPVAYGTALGAAQLNATTNMPGTFSYMPAAGEVLEPGVHELSVTFTPTDTFNCTTVHAVASLTVQKKLPTLITWPTPSEISYGTVLGPSQLNATASVPGTFAYTPAAGHILAPGKYTLSTLFTPADAGKYETVQAVVTLEVEGLPDTPPVQTAPPQKRSMRAFAPVRSFAADPVPVEVTAESTTNEIMSRETRTYKGAVYEKGEDGQWHLQKK